MYEITKNNVTKQSHSHRPGPILSFCYLCFKVFVFPKKYHIAGKDISFNSIQNPQTSFTIASFQRNPYHEFCVQSSSLFFNTFIFCVCIYVNVQVYVCVCVPQNNTQYYFADFGHIYGIILYMPFSNLLFSFKIYILSMLVQVNIVMLFTCYKTFQYMVTPILFLKLSTGRRKKVFLFFIFINNAAKILIYIFS